MSVACPWSDYGCHKPVPYAEFKTHIKSDFVNHAIMRFEFVANERTEWREQYEEDQKEIHNKLEEINDLNIKENLKNVKFLATLVETQSKEIQELKNENKQIFNLKKEISALKEVNKSQNQQIAKLMRLNDVIIFLAQRIDKSEEMD
jgi:valyl-tRNA synthetase